MNIATNAGRVRLPLLLASLSLAAALAGCASPPASSEPTVAPAPTAPPAATVAPAPTAPPAATVAPAPTAASTAQPAPADTTGAVQTVLNYYDAIIQKQFERAYGYWANNGAASNQTLDQ